MRERLTTRIIALSVFWIVLALLATAWLLAWLYRGHIEAHFDSHVTTHVEELVAALEVGQDGNLQLARRPTDPRFYEPGSGWYWEVLIADRVVEKSSSLGEELLEPVVLEATGENRIRTLSGPGAQKLRAHIVKVQIQNTPGLVTILTTAPEMQIRDDVVDFLSQILASFLILGIGLSLAVVFQVTVALRPLKAIHSAINSVRAGAIKRLPRDFPSDVQPLVNELNTLLDHNETLLKRARNRLADLAHAIKTPLTVIRNEAISMKNEQGGLILEQSNVIADGLDHYLSRARISGQGNVLGYRTSVKSVVRDLRFVVDKIFRDRKIEIELCGDGECTFRGESQDLEEMLGNLVDNACKWARRNIRVSGCTEGDRLVLTVEDDGPGIPPERRDDVLQRGLKLDESIPGHGHGLGIVNDIAELYGGTLTLGRSQLGGLKAELDLPAAD